MLGSTCLATPAESSDRSAIALTVSSRALSRLASDACAASADLRSRFSDELVWISITVCTIDATSRTQIATTPHVASLLRRGGIPQACCTGYPGGGPTCPGYPGVNCVGY